MKLGCMTFIVLVLSIMFTSCAKEIPDFEETDIKTPVVDIAVDDNLQKEESEEEVPLYQELEPVITARSWEKAHTLSNKDKAKEFLSAIHLGDREVLEIYLQGDTIDELLKIKADFIITGEKNFVEYFDVLLKMKIAVETDDKESHEKYKDFPSFDCYLAQIVMSISESESDVFPVGVYEYTIKTTDSGSIFVDYFGSSDRYEIFEGLKVPKITDTALYKNYKFIENFLRYNFTASDSELLDPIANFDSLLHITVHTLMAENENFIFTTTLDNFKEYIRLRYGYTDEGTLDKFANTLLKKSYVSKNDDGSYSGSCAHGYSSLMYDLTNIKRIDNLHVYSYTFYADSGHTVPVREMQFTFEENKDSDVMTLRNIKTANLNNLNLALISP